MYHARLTAAMLPTFCFVHHALYPIATWLVAMLLPTVVVVGVQQQLLLPLLHCFGWCYVANAKFLILNEQVVVAAVVVRWCFSYRYDDDLDDCWFAIRRVEELMHRSADYAVALAVGSKFASYPEDVVVLDETVLPMCVVGIVPHEYRLHGFEWIVVP
jgi:hypothetical protein